MTGNPTPQKTTVQTIESLVEEKQHSKSGYLLLKILTIISLVLLCAILMQEVPFLMVCKRQDRNIPPDTEVIISACKAPYVIGVPGGEVLFVREGRTNEIYLLDLRAGEKRNVPDDPLLRHYGTFITSDLVWLEGSGEGTDDPNYRSHYILDLTNGQRYELLDLALLPRLGNRQFDPKNYVYIQSAERIFIHPSENTLIALSTDFRTNPNGRIIFSGNVFPHGNGETLKRLVSTLGKNYEVIDLSLNRSNALSPTGKYDVRKDGIYFSRTSNKIVTRYNMHDEFKSWYYDESGVIIQERPPYWEISFEQLFPHPILKLRLPAP